MSIVFLKGDLFNHGDLQTFAHGCNCAGAMGKGIALEFRRRFPSMYLDYKQRCADGLEVSRRDDLIVRLRKHSGFSFASLGLELV